MINFFRIAAGCVAGLYTARGIEWLVSKIAKSINTSATRQDSSPDVYVIYHNNATAEIGR